ncbi:hypothetical protein LTR09_005691 [Extremus antarcticus]|uniref:Ysc84 actin-binding domain-containing protein n=1 Tax=Extremus antarcticus TaxID=702011 RepID=A0AAJ0DM34_9PEZI|nr:hypothetical protein LTR09_005691 [Extremus antarcticus]
MVSSPSSKMQDECEKAAKVLKSFIDKKKISPAIIANAKGLAIFSGFRGGMYLAGAGGSGVVIARLPNNTWSAPSAFSVRSGSVGIVYGFDMYDCVCVLNTPAAVDAYAHPEVDLGMAAKFGGSNGGDGEAVMTFTKSRGLYGGVTVDGTVIKEKADVNAGMFGVGVTSAKILKGEVEVRGEGVGLKKLFEVVKFAEGRAADGKVVGLVDGGETPGSVET